MKSENSQDLLSANWRSKKADVEPLVLAPWVLENHDVMSLDKSTVSLKHSAHSSFSASLFSSGPQ